MPKIRKGEYGEIEFLAKFPKNSQKNLGDRSRQAEFQNIGH